VQEVKKGEQIFQCSVNRLVINDANSLMQIEYFKGDTKVPGPWSLGPLFYLPGLPSIFQFEAHGSRGSKYFTSACAYLA